MVIGMTGRLPTHGASLAQALQVWDTGVSVLSMLSLAAASWQGGIDKDATGSCCGPQAMAAAADTACISRQQASSRDHPGRRKARIRKSYPRPEARRRIG